MSLESNGVRSLALPTGEPLFMPILDCANGLRLAIGASDSVASDVVDANRDRFVVLSSTTDCYVATGAAPTAADAAGSIFLARGVQMPLAVPKGFKVAGKALIDAGALFVVPALQGA